MNMISSLQVQAFTLFVPKNNHKATLSNTNVNSNINININANTNKCQQRRRGRRRLDAFHVKNNNNDDSDNNDQSKSYTLQITHENQNATITIQESESILSALERAKYSNSNSNSNSGSNNNNGNNNGNNNKFLLSSLPTFPQDCRRGNCLTCAAIHLPNSNKNAVDTPDGADGLAPIVRKAIDDKGYVQTCSSYVTGEGVKLALGVCHDVWEDVWDSGSSRGSGNGSGSGNGNGSGSGRGHDEVAERIRFEAMAKVMRMADERNVRKWAKKTERMLDS